MHGSVTNFGHVSDTTNTEKQKGHEAITGCLSYFLDPRPELEPGTSGFAASILTARFLTMVVNPSGHKHQGWL